MSLSDLKSVHQDRVRRVRIIVSGESGVGKSALVHLLTQGDNQQSPQPTVGCAVSVKLIEYQEPGGGPVKPYFVEFWDISGHDAYTALRPLFYSQINGVILVHDLTRRQTAEKLKGWIGEIAAHADFVAPGPGNTLQPPPKGVNLALGGITVPTLVIGNKSDAGRVVSGGSVLGAAEFLLSLCRRSRPKRRRSDDALLPEFTTKSDDFPTSLRTSAITRAVDMEALSQFFNLLIERRYFPGMAGSMGSLPPMSGASPVRWTAGAPLAGIAGSSGGVPSAWSRGAAVDGDDPAGWGSDDGRHGGDSGGGGFGRGALEPGGTGGRAGDIWPQSAGAGTHHLHQSPLHATGAGAAGVGVSTSVAEGTSVWSGSQYHRKGGRVAREGGDDDMLLQQGPGEHATGPLHGGGGMTPSR